MTAPPAGALEACPFCGGEPSVRHPTTDDGFAIHVACRCGASLFGQRHHFSSDDEAIAAWNRRTHGPALLAALRLREGCERRIAEWRERADELSVRDPVSLTHRMKLRDCADDLARVLEESATDDEAGSR